MPSVTTVRVARLPSGIKEIATPGNGVPWMSRAVPVTVLKLADRQLSAVPAKLALSKIAIALAPNGWRVSGEPRSEAQGRVRCTRGLGRTKITTPALAHLLPPCAICGFEGRR